jgi:excinuclease ABC subunit A
MVFFVFAAVALIWGIVFYAFAHNDASTARPRSFVESLKPLRTSRIAWILSLFYFLTFGGFVALALYMPTLLREIFSLTRDAKSRGLSASHFSFNVPGGRCEACQGEGEVRVEMQFLADVFVPCEQCDGMRFKPQVLDVRYRGKNIHQVLGMTVREALAFFSTSPKVLRRLQVLDEIGLGYLRLGQPATTLSGGEAQRIKIAAHLATFGGDRLLYILDEPTTGLHFDDIAKLLTAFKKLVEAGHTLVVIEHNLDVIKTADYVIDLGPEGGEGGGEVIATGTPEQVAQVEASHTGRALRQVLADGRSSSYAAR